ncbi:unnamed protein product [Mytilus coruscus]|uniref:AAA domain-containing protein n=1 Tax=Mytilus coruscus TaxID=42192 RepID=A0A6J7ZTX7_MYTCO|nr:unnamed protein product [Mytilus coruscus]
MPCESYVVWNNKGGTGKTTLTFQLSAEYAELHPEKKVVVIDMCPQANVSSALLAKNSSPLLPLNPGEVVLEGKSYEKTICGYLLMKLERGSTELGINELMDFLTFVHSTNNNISKNVFLMCGDLHLEELSTRLQQERQLIAIRNISNWKRVTLFIKDYIQRLGQNGEFVFFIDTNPSFSIYTEMAISAAERLIVPFTADDFSLAAIKAMLYLVYGNQTDQSDHRRSLIEHQYYWLAKTHQVNRPKLHLFVNNRATYHTTRAAAAFSGVANEVRHLLNRVYGKQSAIFSQPLDKLCPDLHDFHSAGVISLHTGCPISKLKPGKHSVFDQTVQVQSNIGTYKADIKKIIKML